MNLRVKQLYFVDGITPLGGRQSVAADKMPGVPTAESITRVGSGYLVGWSGKLYFVPDARVVCALVEDVDAVAAPRPEPVAAPTTTATPPPAGAVEVAPGILQLPNGQMLRAGAVGGDAAAAPAASAPAPATDDEPKVDAQPYQPKRRRRGATPEAAE